MSWWRTLLGTVAVVTLCVVAHPPSIVALPLEVRSGPGAAYDVVATIAPGSYVVLAQEQEWYKIQLADGREGWIKSTMVRPESPARTHPVATTTPAMPSHMAPAAAPAISQSTQTGSAPADRQLTTVTTPPGSRRTALVIGNAAYHLGPLRNAGKDATDIATMLRRLGFDVTLLRDVPLPEMEEAVNAFNLRLRQGGMGLFYFAGHGLQVDGENYLVPLKARIERQQDVRYQALPVGRVLGAMEDAGNGLNVLILDACRNTPFTRSWRSTPAGLAAPPMARGTLIAYATAPGGVADDGEELNGVYTKHLLQAMTLPGLSIEHVFKQVRSGVVVETSGKQTPWESSSLLGDFAFLPSQPGTVPAAAPVPPAPAVASPPVASADPETLMWSMAERSAHPEDVLAFLQAYPASRFAPVARLRLQQLQRQNPPSGSVPTRQSAGPVTPGVTAVSPPLPATGVPSQRPTERVALQHVPEDKSRESTVSNEPTDSKAPGLSSAGYTLIRRIYCEDVSTGVITSSIDLIVTSFLSCAEAKNTLVVMEQEKDNCRFPKSDTTFVDERAKESRKRAREWVGTHSCASQS